MSYPSLSSGRFSALLASIRAVICLIIIFSAGSETAAASALEDAYYLGKMPGGAALGRGGAYSAVRGDYFASYWNPASLAALGESAFVFSSDFLTMGTKDKVKAISDPLSGGKISYIGIAGPEVGIYWMPLSRVTDKSTGTVNGDYYELKRDIRVNVAGVSVGVRHAENVDFGMNINFLFGTLGEAEILGDSASAEVPYGYGWGLDWGLIYRVSEYLSAGVSLKNGPSYIYWDKGYGRDRLPVVLRSGFEIRLTDLMSSAFEYEHIYADSSVSPRNRTHLGFEHVLTENLTIRAGVYGSNLDREEGRVYTAGLGYSFERYNVDIAARQSGETADDRPVRLFTVSGTMPF